MKKAAAGVEILQPLRFDQLWKNYRCPPPPWPPPPWNPPPPPPPWNPPPPPPPWNPPPPRPLAGIANATRQAAAATASRRVIPAMTSSTRRSNVALPQSDIQIGPTFHNACASTGVPHQRQNRACASGDRCLAPRRPPKTKPAASCEPAGQISPEVAPSGAEEARTAVADHIAPA